MLRTLALTVAALAALLAGPTAQATGIDALTQPLQQLAQHPEQRDAFVARALAASALGAHSQALLAVRQHPEWFDTAQALAIEQDALAQKIRFAGIARDVLPPARREIAADAALLDSEQLADASWADGPDLVRQLDASLADGAQRTLFDRVVALRQREAHREAVLLFDTLRGTPPDYVVAAAADSLLALKQPERARQLYERAIAGRPDPVAWEWRLSLAYALLDTEQHQPALDQLDRLDFDVRMARVKTLQNLDPSDDGDTDGWLDRLRICRANFERYAQQLDRSDRQLAAVTGDAPFDLDARSSRSSLMLERKQPRRALASAQRLSIDYPDSPWPLVAQMEAQLDLSDHTGARETLDQLRIEHGESNQAARLERQLLRKQAGTARMSVSGAHNSGSADSPLPVTETRLDASLESPLINDHWRLLAGTSAQISELPEGTVHRRRSALGVRYESPDLDVSGQFTSSPSLHEAGFTARATAALDDAWRVGARVARNADDVPMRAVAAGVRLDRAGLEAEYQPNEKRGFTAGGDNGRFSDGNHRDGLWLGWRERWLDRPDWVVETSLTRSTVRFERQDVPYFSPAQYTTTGLAISASQQLHRRYDTSWKHRLTVEPTMNVQQGFASHGGVNVRYEHEWEVNGNWGGRAAIDHVRRPYDGNLEGRWIASVELFTRF